MSHWLVGLQIALLLLLTVSGIRGWLRARWYRDRYLAEQRSTAQLHEAIFHLRQHLEKAQKAAAGSDEVAS